MRAGWEEVLLTDICRPKQWTTISMTDLKESGYPVYGANGKIGFYDEYNHEKPTLLITCRGATCGTMNICEPFSYVTGNSMALDNLDSSVDLKFLYYSLQKRGFEDVISGTAQPQITREGLAYIKVPLPPLPEQKRIAAQLAQADHLRQLRRNASQLGESYLQSAFLAMFGDLVENEKGWKFQSLGKIAEVVSGVTKGQKYNGKETVEVPYLRVANVQDGYLDLSEIKTINVLPKEIEQLRLLSGDVVMTEGGDFDKLGRGAIWHGSIDPCIHQNHIFRVRFSGERVLPVFFAQFLQTRFTKHYFLKASKQTTNLASINMTQLKGLPVPLPPLPEQERFAQIVTRYEKLRAQMSESTRQAEMLFQGLLHESFGSASHHV